MDSFTPEKRQLIMSKVRSKNSKVERITFSYLRSNGVYFQKHYKKAFGNPDIALPRRKKAVFIDSDFWHGRKNVKITQTKFWMDKIARNRARDEIVNSELKKEGWEVLRVWESDVDRLKTRSRVLSNVRDFLIN